MGERQPADDLARFLDAYTEAWNAGDPDGIVGAYATPCSVVKDGRVLRHQDRAAKRRYFGDLLAAEDGGGASSATWCTSDDRRFGDPDRAEGAGRHREARRRSGEERTAVRAHRPSRGSLLTALVTGLLAAAFLWPRTRTGSWTAYAPGPPSTELHLGSLGPWRNVVGLPTSYPLALLVGALIAGLVLSSCLISRARSRHR